MAGIAGFVGTNADKNVLSKMIKSIKHRGPDYELQYIDDFINLSYIGIDLEYEFDRKEIFESDKNIVVVCGYISNIDKLSDIVKQHENNVEKNLIPSKNIELIYRNIGLDVCDVIKGSYLILIYEKESKKLIFIRDRFGSQPLYYYQTKNGLVFASEIKAILEHPEFVKELNTEAIVPYLVFQSPSLKETFFKNVYTVYPASYLIYNGNIKEEYYWDIKFAPQSMDLDYASNKINEILENSIKNKTKYFKNKDLIGQSLSGGVDSSYLASRFRPKRTFTVGYNDKEFSEIDNARELSKIIGSEHIAEVIDADISFKDIEKMAYIFDMPLANLSAIPMYYLSKRVSEFTNVVMSGEGSDEFFGGYYEYTEPKCMNTYKKLPLSIRKILGNKMLKMDKDFKGKNFIVKGLPTEEWYIGQAKIFHENEALNVVKGKYRKTKKIKDITSEYFNKVKDLSDIQKKQYLDFHLWMINDIDLKADRMNIAHSVQLITPILDEDLLDFARKLPDNLKIQENKVKIAFRNAAIKYLPDDWAKRKKLGYVVPLKKWIKEEKFSEKIFEKLTGEIANKFFNIEEIKKIIADNISGKRPNHKKIWTLYMFIVWYEEYFIKR